MSKDRIRWRSVTVVGVDGVARQWGWQSEFRGLKLEITNHGGLGPTLVLRDGVGSQHIVCDSVAQAKRLARPRALRLLEMSGSRE